MPLLLLSLEVGLQRVKFALLLAVPYLGDKFLGAEREVALDHPVVVGGFFLKHLLDCLSLVLAEVEHLAVLGIVADMTHKVGPLAVGRKSAKGGNIVDHRLRDPTEAVLVGDPLVSVELSLEHHVGGDGVGGSAVGVLEVFLAVELICSHEGALLHLVEDILHVDQAAAFEVEIHPRTEELLDEQRHIRSCR